jgi:hypothetical protein
MITHNSKVVPIFFNARTIIFFLLLETLTVPLVAVSYLPGIPALVYWDISRDIAYDNVFCSGYTVFP